MVKISDLRMREVINVLDGKKLGNIIDIDLDLEKGRVLSFILPGRVRGWSIFSRREDIIVPWDKIVRIGRDVILVEVPVYGELEARPANSYSGRYNEYVDDDDDY